jgi:hypothetical protein
VTAASKPGASFAADRLKQHDSLYRWITPGGRLPSDLGCPEPRAFAAVAAADADRGAARPGRYRLIVNHTGRLPRWRKLASFAAQSVTLRFCFAMWWRRAAWALNGIAGSGAKQGLPSYPSRSHGTNR